MKIKLSGAGCHAKGVVAPGVLLTLSILTSKSVPDPDRAVKSFEKAEMRSVLIVLGVADAPGVGVGRTLPVTFQLPVVRPAVRTGGLEKVNTVESKVKSPWKPT